MKFGYVVVYVDDVGATLDFYRRAFGFETRHFDAVHQYGELDTGSTALAVASHELGRSILPGGFSRLDAEAVPVGVELSFVTPDVNAAFDKAVAEGAVVVIAPKVMPWGQTVAYVRSIEGTLVALSDR